MIVFLNGEYLNADEAKISIFDHGFLYGDGVYETLRTYNGKIWQPQEHLNRLKKSAKLIGIDLPWRADELEKWLNETIERNGLPESRIRITITRGENDFSFTKAKNPTILIVVQKLNAEQPEVYKNGVPTITFEVERLLPEAKTINLLPMILARQNIGEKEAYEAILVSPNKKSASTNDMFVREGSITNIFIVEKGRLLTPKSHILAGTTRAAILKVAAQLGIFTKIQDLTVKELYKADEAFLTNAPRGIIPIASVDSKKIGTGRPGPITKLLQKEFQKRVKG